MALTLNPISNPDDLRAEASKVPVHTVTPTSEQPAASVDVTPAADVTLAPAAPISTPTSETPAVNTPEVTIPAAEQEWRPYQTVGSTAAAPVGNAVPIPPSLAADEVSYGYTYMLPAGVYAIVALSAATALLYWIVIIFFKLHRIIPIAEALAITIFGIGLLSRNIIVRYGAIVASGAGAAYMAYQSFRLMQFASSDLGTLFSGFGYASYTTGVIVIYLVITIALAVCCGYLLTARVARAFR